MTREGCDSLVVTGRARRTVKPGFITKVRLSIRRVPRKFFLPLWLIKKLGFFLLNFVPIIGPLILVVIEAPKRGKKAHRRYFQLKGYSEAEITNFVKARRGQYTGFENKMKIYSISHANYHII